MSSHVLTIGGKTVSTPRTFEVLNPFDESLAGECPEGTIELVDQAVKCAREALTGWSAKPDAERARGVMDIASLIELHHAELGRLVTLEQRERQSGPGANLEVGGAEAWTRATAALTLPEEIIQDDKTARIVLRRKPV